MSTRRNFCFVTLFFFFLLVSFISIFRALNQSIWIAIHFSGSVICSVRFIVYFSYRNNFWIRRNAQNINVIRVNRLRGFLLLLLFEHWWCIISSSHILFACSYQFGEFDCLHMTFMSLWLFYEPKRVSVRFNSIHFTPLLTKSFSLYLLQQGLHRYYPWAVVALNRMTLTTMTNKPREWDKTRKNSWSECIRNWRRSSSIHSIANREKSVVLQPQ